MNILALRSRIETILTGLIGTYTFANGEQVPALTIDDGADSGNNPPEGTGVSGLEVILQINAGYKLNGLIGGNLIYSQVAIDLKQWDITATTVAAMQRLMALPELKAIGPRVLRSTKLDSIETQTVTLEFSTIYTLRNR
jgi:hypothetical protein